MQVNSDIDPRPVFTAGCDVPLKSASGVVKSMQSSWIFSPRTRAVWLRTLVVIALAAGLITPALLLR